jgi:hypothetical protein
VAAVGGYSPSVSAGTPGPIYTSTNAGGNWTKQTKAPVKDWFSVSSSADGKKLAALAFGSSASLTNAIYTSLDAGVTWTVNYAPATAWEWVASSADGNKLVAVANLSNDGLGRVYTLQNTPSPELDLSISENGPLASWIIPSQNFTLQQSFDLSSWTDVTNPPALNLTTLQNELVVPISGGNGYYRLKSN